MSKLDRRLHDLTLVEVTFSRERNPSIADDHTVEAVVHTKGPNLVARESAPTYETAIDRLLDKLQRQVERYRDKRTVEMRRRAQGGEAVAAPEEPIELPRGRIRGVDAGRRPGAVYAPSPPSSTVAQRIRPRWL